MDFLLLEHYPGNPSLVVAYVLGSRGGSEICPSIVHAVLIYMVGQHSVGNLYEFTVHVYRSEPGCFWASRSSYRVEIARPLYRKPFVSSQALVVGRVHLCVLRLRHANQAKRIPVAQPSIQKHRQHSQMANPIADFDNDRDDFLPRRISSECVDQLMSE